MQQGGQFLNFLFRKDEYLFRKFHKCISIEYRDDKKILVLNVGFAPEADIDELISLKSIWEDFALIDPYVSIDPFLISGTVKYMFN